MPITKSAKKALRQSVRRRDRNNKKREAFRGLIHDIRKLISEKKKSEAKKLLPAFYASVDKAVKTGVLKMNNASRKKSRVTKAVDALS